MLVTACEQTACLFDKNPYSHHPPIWDNNFFSIPTIEKKGGRWFEAEASVQDIC